MEHDLEDEMSDDDYKPNLSWTLSVVPYINLVKLIKLIAVRF